MDERLSIRGFGARSNFGLRGVKVLLDGVPQTLPDGQSQLNNLDLSLVNRVEVLRGGASALYGNASGGVVSFTTNAAPAQPWLISARAEGGTFGTAKEELVTGAPPRHAGRHACALALLDRRLSPAERHRAAAPEPRPSTGMRSRARRSPCVSDPPTIRTRGTPERSPRRSSPRTQTRRQPPTSAAAPTRR